jgi:hypothetical protein
MYDEKGGCGFSGKYFCDGLLAHWASAVVSLTSAFENISAFIEAY